MSEFASKIANYVKEYAPRFGIGVVSPIVAQAILETGNGVDANAQVKVINHNVFGLKYNHNDPTRITSFSHFFTDGGWEVVEGERTELDPATSYWYGFCDMEQCVLGYFEFIQKSWYAPLKECNDVETFCYTLLECGYATDPEYGMKLLSIIERYELEQYDRIEEKRKMRMNIHAGHNPDGMVACGAIGLVKESTENRLVTAEVIRQLEVLGHCVYDCTVNDGTSSSDVLQKIVEKCNANEVDLDVSIHLNAFDGNAKGTEVLVYSTSSASNPYATKTVNAISELGFTNRGVKVRSDLYVLKNTKSPAMLVECCFCDNVDDVERYDVCKMAGAIVKGITGEEVGEEVLEDNLSVLYRVQVGAYSVKSNAEGMLSKLKAAGFEGFITKV